MTAAAEQAAQQADAEQASQTPAQSMADALAELSTPSFEETLSALDEVGAPSEQEAAATLAEDGALDPQETLASDAPILPTGTAEATPASFTTNAPHQPAQELTPANSANSAATNTNTTANTTGNDLVVAAPVHLPPAEPRPWYRSRRPGQGGARLPSGR